MMWSGLVNCLGKLIHKISSMILMKKFCFTFTVFRLKSNMATILDVTFYGIIGYLYTRRYSKRVSMNSLLLGCFLFSLIHFGIGAVISQTGRNNCFK